VINQQASETLYVLFGLSHSNCMVSGFDWVIHVPNRLHYKPGSDPYIRQQILSRCTQDIFGAVVQPSRCLFPGTCDTNHHILPNGLSPHTIRRFPEHIELWALPSSCYLQHIQGLIRLYLKIAVFIIQLGSY
jgi:hypothetical protein